MEADKPGATIIPVIISSDKTQVTLFGGKQAYPVYITIGNIPKDIRRKPSRHAQILLAYLPVAKFEHITNKSARRRIISNVLHASLRGILEPLKDAGKNGILMSSGDGVQRRCHPIFAAHCGDYMEHIAVVGCKNGECPCCEVENEDIGDYDPEDMPPIHQLNKVLSALALYDTDPLHFPAACKEAHIKPICHPYWQDLPYTNIFTSIPPDILHQLHTGLIKHMLSWLKAVYDKTELDARIAALPRNHHVRHFAKGVTQVSRYTGKEYNEIAKFILGLVLDMPIDGDRADALGLAQALQGLLDFCYLAQYPVQSTSSLKDLEAALQLFHEHKQVLIKLGARKNFKIPKLHYLIHYVDLIQWLGSADNYNTEHTERLHIDFAKQAYRATNHKDELVQMTAWLERKEKIHQHHSYIQWRLAGKPSLLSINTLPSSSISMTLQPTRKAVFFDAIKKEYQAPYIRDALARYVVQFNNPDYTAARVEREAASVNFHFRSLPVYHKAKLWLGSTSHHRLMADEWDVIHAHKACVDSRGRTVSGRFDTVLVNTGDGEYTGKTGK